MQNTPHPTGRTHRGLPILFNPGNGMECVSFKGMLYSLDVIDKAMDDCVRDAAPELLEALGNFSMSGCEADVLNPCISGWKPGKPMMHWGGQDKMCRVCYARAVIAKAEGRS